MEFPDKDRTCRSPFCKSDVEGRRDMPVMDYLTKGNVALTNQPKVYFCCHEEELEQYLHSIAEEIWEITDCAIFYDAKPNVKEEEEEWQEMLLDMNLFVVMVTKKFLETKNRAKEDYFYAVKNHVVVLPWLEEASLITSFNKVCGELQVLNSGFTTDDTEIPYKEKLKLFLQTILMDDDLTERIHKSSDGHIFLSYRKKDRRHLLALLNLLREDEDCQDIAIWYDEFLKFGEEFSEQIAKKLCEGKVFLLNVTPNLVNEKNYVQEEEYPLAVKEKKVIIPVEMVKTERTSLVEQYKEIPECIGKEEGVRVAEEVKNAFFDSQPKETQNPERTFLIGMGFMTGTDREKNVELGLKKIIEAAEAGVEEAISKLVTIYEHGDGVKINLPEAIKWQEKLVAQISVSDVNTLIWQQIILGDLLKKNQQIEEAKEIYRQAIANVKPEVMEGNYLLTLAKNKLAKLESAQIQFTGLQNDSKKKKIEKRYKGAINKRISDEEKLRYCYEAAMELESMDAHREARDAYKTASRYMSSLKKRHTEGDFYYNKIALSHHIGDLTYKLGEYQEAEQIYLQTVAVNEEWLKCEDTDDVWSLLSISYEKLADYYRDCMWSESGYRKALEYIEKSIACSEKLEVDESLSNYTALAAGYRRKCGLLTLLGEYDKAVEASEKAIENSKKARKIDLNAELEVAHAYDDKGDVYFEQIRLSDVEMDGDTINEMIKNAMSAYEEGLKIREELIKNTDITEEERMEICQGLTYSYDKMGGISYFIPDKEQAKNIALFYMEQNVALCEELYKVKQNNIHIMRDLFVAYMRMMEVYQMPPVENEKARAFYEKALKFAKDTGLEWQAETALSIKNMKKRFK